MKEAEKLGTQRADPLGLPLLYLEVSPLLSLRPLLGHLRLVHIW